MPYKDINKRREFRRIWYKNNKDSEKEFVKSRKIKLRNWFENFKKGLKCSKCQENHPATIDFHHKSGNKEKEISSMVSNGYSIKKIQTEIQKCEILCSNCHRKLHHKNKNL